MQKIALNALVALVIAGSTGQTAAASEHHVSKAHHASVVARNAGAYRRAYNQWNGSYGGGNTWLHASDINPSGS